MENSENTSCPIVSDQKVLKIEREIREVKAGFYSFQFN